MVIWGLFEMGKFDHINQMINIKQVLLFHTFDKSKLTLYENYELIQIYKCKIEYSIFWCKFIKKWKSVNRKDQRCFLMVLSNTI